LDLFGDAGGFDMSLLGNPNGVGLMLPLICPIVLLPKDKFMLMLALM